MALLWVRDGLGWLAAGQAAVLALGAGAVHAGRVLGRRLSFRPLDDPAHYRLNPHVLGRDDAGKLYAVALGGSL